MATQRSSTRVAWTPLVVAALVVPTVLAGLTLLWPRHQIESTLTGTAGQALSAAGFPGASVAFTGRDATISGVPAGQAAAAVSAVEAATGVRIADAGGLGAATAGSGGAASVAPAPAQPAQPFTITRQGSSITVAGTVGTDAQKADLLAAVTEKSGGSTVIDQIVVMPGATLPSGIAATSVGALTAALAAAPSDVAASVTTSGVTLTGTVPTDAVKTSTAAAVASALPGVTVDDELMVAAAAAPSAPADLDAAAKQALQARITALMATPITFGPDSPQLTPQGQATVAQVVAAVKAAPGARLQIDGFVATGPGNGRLTAQQLSDQRAATVQGALVAGGVPADHLTATGRGEGTGAGAANRRVAITVV